MTRNRAAWLLLALILLLAVLALAFAHVPWSGLLTAP
jgi:hypothetical protein